MTFDEIIDGLKAETDAIIDEYAPQIVENSDENPQDLEELPEELIAALLLLWNAAVDDMAESALETTNEQTGSTDGAAMTDEEIEQYKLIGGYFFLEAMRRSFHRIHGSNIALQVADEDREEAVENAVTRSKEDVANTSFTELALAYGAAVMIEQVARGIQSYRWQTVGDSRVRPTHAANNGRIFNWADTPATGHPATAHNCRCSAVPVLLNNKTDNKIMAKSIKGLSVVAMGDDKVSLSISGEIGDDWEGVNTTDWQVQHLNGITEETQEIDVYINSAGGDLSHGVSIYLFLKNHPATVNTIITGEASSAASLIFLAGDNRYMPEGTVSGVHNPYAQQCFCDLDFEEAQHIADQLKPFADSMVEVYAANMTIDEDEIRRLLSESHVITSSESISIGFATSTDRKPVEMSATTESIKAHLEALNQDFVNNVKDGGNQMPKEKDDKTKDIAEVAEIKASNDILKHRNGELTTELNELKARHEALEASQADLLEKAKADVLKDQAELSEVVAKSKEVGIDVEGETAEDAMRFVITAKGVKNPEAFEGDTLKSTFDLVLAQYGNKQADDVFSQDDTETKTKADPFAEANKKV